MGLRERLKGKHKSAAEAKERLKLVLIHDRTELTPAQLEALKDELLEVIGRYIPISRDAVRIQINQEGRSQRLIADIPLQTTPRR